MTDLNEHARPIFHAALSLNEPAQRADYLDVACRGSDQLRNQVDSLLTAYEEAGGFMEASAASSQQIGAPTADEPSETIGHYKLLQQIGEGGFGVVYMAEQQQPIVRKVALKIIKLGMDTKQVIARFEAERQALAMMNHPNIATVLDGGATETGRPFFVMELVRGTPVMEYCDQKQLTNQERLSLFLDICGAIQHAHQKGIIHRDLKPNNILVTLHDGQPVPKVIDFGIAKATQGRLTDKTLFTRFEQFIGTPAYMSPEQAEMSGLDIDTRSDIYSLGVLMYELLTGQIPFDRTELANAGFDEMRRRIREEEPPTPSTQLTFLQQDVLAKVAQNRHGDPAQLPGLLRGDLDWIVMKAIEKDRTRRYETASALAEDIHRHLRQEPVSAVPPSAMYRFQKFTRRNRAAITLLGAIAAILIMATTVSTSQAIRAMKATATARSETERALTAENDAEEKTQRAIESEAEVKRNLYVADLATAKREFDQLNTQRTVELVNKYIPGPNETDFRGFEWRWLWNQCNQERFRLIGHTTKLRDLRFSPDGRWLVTGGKDGTARLWNLETKQEVWSKKRGNHCNHVDISSNGKLLVTAFWTSRQRNPEDQSTTILWNISNPRYPQELRPVREGDRFSPDGESLFAIKSGNAYDLLGNFLHQIAVRSENITWLGGRHLSRDGKTLIARNGIWDVSSGIQLGSLPRHDGFLDHDWESAAVSPIDDNLIVTGCAEGARVWDRAGNPLHELPGTAGTPISGIDFSKDGDFLAVRQALGAIRVFDTETWIEVTSFRTAAGNTLAFSPVDNNLFITGGEDGAVRGWSVSPEKVPDPILDHPAKVMNLKFSPNGRVLAVGMMYGAVRFWDVQNRKELFTIPAKGREDLQGRHYHSYSFDFVAFSPDSRFVAIIGPKNTVSVCDMEHQKILPSITLPEGLPEEVNKAYWSVEFSRDGRRLYTGFQVGDSGVIEVWEWISGNGTKLQKHSERSTELIWHRSMASSPDGHLLATTGLADWWRTESESRLGTLWKLPEMQILQHLRLTAPESEMLNLSFSPNGTRLAISTNPPAVTIWDTSTWQQTALLPHPMEPEHVSWSPDGSRLASSDATATTNLWDIETRQVVSTFRGTVAEFSPDGTTLAVGGQGSIHIADEKLVGRVTLHYAPRLEEIDRLRVSR